MPDGTSTTQAPLQRGDLRDFSDRLPPVLVKELRQGLRGKMFVVPFLVLQGLLMLSSGQGTRSQTQFFWHCLAIMLVCLLPSRNLGALGEERQANTLDTLILTRLTPWRIVWGKWCATAAQSALTAVAAMPYLLVRYLNSGTNFVHEGLLLLVLLLLSGAMAGVFTVFSTVSSPLARNGLAAAVLAVAYGAFCFPLIQILSSGPQPGFSSIGAMAVTALWATLFCLSHAASTIAPASENHSTPRRLLSFAALLLCGAINRFVAAPDFYLVAGSLVILLFSCAVEMGERIPEFPVVRWRGLPGKAMAAVFHPGWPSGVVFSAGLWTLAAVLFADSIDLRFLQFATLCFVPVTARLVLPSRMRQGTAPFVLLAAASQLLSLLAGQLLPWGWSDLAAFLPAVRPRPPLLEPILPMALFWGALALIVAIGPLVRLVRRLGENPDQPQNSP